MPISPTSQTMRIKSSTQSPQAGLKLQMHLEDEPDQAAAAAAALHRWRTWPLAPALEAWSAAVAAAKRERLLVAQADRARFESLGLKVLVGFGLAVRATAARAAAQEHWSVAARRGVLRGWLEAAREQKVRS